MTDERGFVGPRKRADAVGREEFLFVEHVAQHAHQPLARGNREQTDFAAVRLRALHVRDVPREVLAILEKPAHPLSKAGQILDRLLLEHLHREERNDPDQRAHPQRFRHAIDVKLIVVKAVLFVPQSEAAEGVHRVHDLHEMLEELRGHVFVGRLVAREFDRDREHRAAVESHPRGAVRLLEDGAAGKRFRAVEEADIVEAEEAAGEEMFAGEILAVHPPGEVEQQLLKSALQEEQITLSIAPPDLVNAPAGPGMHRWIHVGEIPLVGGDLAVRVHVPFAEKEQQLLLRKLRIDPRHRDHVEGEIPRGVPGVLPFIRHRNHVAVVKVFPVRVARFLVPRRGRRHRGIAAAPLLHHVVVELLRPEQPGVGLPHHEALIVVNVRRKFGVVECFRLHPPDREGPLESGFIHDQRRADRGEPQAQLHLAVRGNLQRVVRRRLGPEVLRVHRLALAVDYVVVEGVLHIVPCIRHAEEPRGVCLVLGEKKIRLNVADPLRLQAEFPERRMRRLDHRSAHLLDAWLRARVPRPGIAEPQRRQHVDRRSLRSAVRDRDADGNILLRLLRIFDKDIEVAPVLEDPAIFQLKLRQLAPAPRIFRHQPRVGKLRLRIFVERAHVGVRRRGVEIPVPFLHILAVIALRIGQSEEAFFQKRIAPIPQREPKTHPALAVADPEQPILAPPIRPAPRVFVRQVIPRIAIGGVILPHRAPLALCKIRSPALPVFCAGAVLGETLVLGGFVGHHARE